MTCSVIDRPLLGGALLEEAKDLLTSNLYEAPTAKTEHLERARESWVWLVVLGFVAFAVALAWESYCIWEGGEPYINFNWWEGFTITCDFPDW